MVGQLNRRGLDVVMLAAEGLAAESLGQLRMEIGLEHEFVEVLENWPGVSPGYLVIDALDAARSEGTARTLRMLIDRVIAMNNRWRVVASIRKFDLRYSAELRRLFRGNPPADYADLEFAQIRHVNIPLLDETEMAQVKNQSNELRTLIESAPSQLRELLRVSFNLGLVAALMDDGATAAELTPITTQIELLDRYWTARVIREDGRGDAREAVLRLAVEEMVRRRALRAPRSSVARDPLVCEPLRETLSAGVLTTTAPRMLLFYDNLIFGTRGLLLKY